MNVRRRLVALAGPLTMGLVVAACGTSPAPSAEEPPAEVETIEGSELSRITLSEQAAQRLGIATEAVTETASDLLAIPYAAVLYDAEGKTWAYESPDENVFVRSEIVVDRIEGELAYLAEGPPVGTEVVTVGAAELYGTETGVGGGH